VALRIKYRLRVFEKTVLRTKFGPKKDNVTGKFRRLRHGDLHDYHSGDQIKKNEMGGA
jgi:hypothetical protein